MCECIKRIIYNKYGVGAKNTVTESARESQYLIGIAILVDDWSISQRLPKGIRANRFVRAAEGGSFTESWRSSGKVRCIYLFFCSLRLYILYNKLSLSPDSEILLINLAIRIYFSFNQFKKK